MAAQSQGNPYFIAGFVLVVFLLAWHVFTLRPTFDARGLNDEQLQMMEFNGDIVRLPDGKPAANVRVAAMVPPEPGLNVGNASELAAIGKTDAAGRYRLEDVPLGHAV